LKRGYKLNILISSLGVLIALGLFGNTIVQAQTDPATLNDENVSLSDIKYAGTDGTCQWYISNDDILHIKSGTLASGSLGKMLTVNENKYSKVKFDNEKQNVKRIIFEGNVYLPEDSSWLFTGLGNNLDGTSGLVEIKNADRLNTTNVKDMSHMFDGLSSLKSVDVSTWDVSGVMDMSYMFHNTGLAVIDVSNWNTGNVLDMQSMFSSSNVDSELEDLNVSAWNVSNVKNMSSMFAKVDKLKNLDVSNWNISNVEKMKHMFSGAQKIRVLNFSNWDNKQVKSTGLLSGTNIKRLDLPPNFSLRNSDLGQDLTGNDNLQKWMITDRKGNERVITSKQLIKSNYVGVAKSAKNLAVFDVNVPNNVNQRIVNKNVLGSLKNGTATLTIKIPQKDGYKVNKNLLPSRSIRLNCRLQRDVTSFLHQRG
jgi:bacterial surface protein 26-residue repeat